MKQFLKKIPCYKQLRAYYSITKGTYSNKYNFFQKTKFLKIFLSDLNKYKKDNKNNNFKLSWDFISPYIYDKTENTPVEPTYFYQDTWCAGKVFQNKPNHHYDIGSKAEMIGIISQFVPTTMIDIRPIELKLENLFFKKGDILNLPFKDNEIKSLSSICVIEHIGLGRYGDPIDSFGSEKAIKEIKRVLTERGNLYISLPIDSENKIYFNAHRTFTRNYILELFKPLQLVEEKYIYKKELLDKYEPEKGFGTGLFWFRK